MIGLIIRAIFVVLLFQLGATVFRWFRGNRPQRDRVRREKDNEAVPKTDYTELSPYEIEDADYEELPRRED